MVIWFLPVTVVIMDQTPIKDLRFCQGGKTAIVQCYLRNFAEISSTGVDLVVRTAQATSAALLFAAVEDWVLG